MNTNTVQITLQFKDDGTIAVVDQSKGKLKDLDKTVKDSQGNLSAFHERWIAITAKVGLAGAAFYAAKHLVYDMSKEIASAGNDILRMSRNFNMSTGDLQKWSYAARMADVDIQGFGEGFKFLTRSMGEALQGPGDAARAFSILGINLKDTTGKTKDQQTVMLEAIGSLEKYADGVNRDSLMLAVFGRGWLSVKPLIDQGTKAIEENKKEAERLNTILGKDTIRALSESEDAFKKWEMVFKVAKAETFQPMITIFTSMLERILALRTAFKEGGFKGAFQDVLAAQEEQRINVLPPAAWTKEWVAGWTPPKKPEAPAPMDLKKYFEEQKPYYESLGKKGEELERGAYGGMENAAFWVQLKEEKELEEKINEAIQDRVGFRAYEIPTLEQINEMEKRSLDFEEERIRLSAQEATTGRSDWVKMYAETPNTITDILKMESTWQEFGNTVNSVWSENVKGIVGGTKTIGDAFKNMTTGMADVFISSVAKMITNWILFQNVQGTYKEGAGAIGWLGTLVKGIFPTAKEGGYAPGGFLPIKAFQGGGYANRPTLGLIGEGGEGEYIIPESKMRKDSSRGGSGGTTIIVLPHNYDKSFSEMIQRNPGSIINEIFKNARKSGAMKGIIRSV